MTDAPTLLLDAAEARVLGCLVEKEATTPEQYPLTENAALQAANQKTSREPVMALETGEVARALRGLEAKGLARRVDGARALRFEHSAARTLELTRGQLVALALLMLRGPQTAAELQSRSERLHRYADADDLAHALERLAARGFAVALPRAPGQREGRWAHLLCGPIDFSAMALDTNHAPAREPAARGDDALLARIEALEARVAALEARLAPGEHDAP
ncbi:MAG: YceH family protein [Silanimonas sp.]